MRSFAVTCDRCGAEIQYNAIKDELIDGAEFMIPIVLPTGLIAKSARQIDLCQCCIYHLSGFVKGEI